jgi:hypothetical protein
MVQGTGIGIGIIVDGTMNEIGNVIVIETVIAFEIIVHPGIADYRLLLLGHIAPLAVLGH